MNTQEKRNHLIPEIFAQSPAEDYGVFVLSPLAPGFGVTLGTALRRTLFSSTQGYAITHIKVSPSVPHEFATIDGVREDLQEIILNLKRVRLKKIKDTPETTVVVLLKGREVFKASDITEASSSFEVIHGDDIICHMESDVNVEIQLTVAQGKGYEPAEEHKPEQKDSGLIPIDAIFNPISNVTFNVENMLVGDRKDYEKLILKVTTDGAVAPQKALEEAAHVLCDMFGAVVSKQIDQAEKASDGESESLGDKTQIETLLRTPLSELGLSSRVVNSLEKHDIQHLKDLVGKKVPDLLRLPNFGKKCLQDLETFLREKNISLEDDVLSST